MSLKDCQKDVNEFTSRFIPQYWQPLEILARLIEETGELGREVNDRWGAKKKKSTEDKKEVEDEISDIVFTLCCLANSQNIDLDDAWKNMMNKLYKRDSDRYEKREESFND